MRTFSMGIAFLFLALGVPALAGQPVVRIGVSLSLTGEFSAAGRKALAGVRMRVDDHNFRLGDGDSRITLVVRDDKSNLETATRNLEELVAVDKVPAVVGPLSSNLMLPMRETANRLEVMLLSPSVTNPGIGKDGDWAFRLLFDDEFQGTALAQFLYRKQGARKVAAIVNKRLVYANFVTRSFRRAFEEEGGKIVAEEHYEWVAQEDREFDFPSARSKPSPSGEIAKVCDMAYNALSGG